MTGAKFNETENIFDSFTENERRWFISLSILCIIAIIIVLLAIPCIIKKCKSERSEIEDTPCELVTFVDNSKC